MCFGHRGAGLCEIYSPGSGVSGAHTGPLCSRIADTVESTPPDRPTATRADRGMCAVALARPRSAVSSMATGMGSGGRGEPRGETKQTTKEGESAEQKCDVSSVNGGVYKARGAFSTIQRSEASGLFLHHSQCAHLTWHPDPWQVGYSIQNVLSEAAKRALGTLPPLPI